MKVTTRVQVTLEVIDLQPYEEKSSAADIVKAASARALHVVACLNRPDLIVVGEPVAKLVVVL